MAKASPIRESNQSSPSRAYNEALTKQILSLSHGYRHRWRRHEPTRAEHDPARTKGDLIRERIAANAQRRFSAAEAMKLEAGVQGHDINGEKHGGIAFSATGKILAPAGETLAQLATLAHECGHVFLHRTGTPGNSLPAHVKEMEAESYAHQAFRAHGMQMPSKITNSGRLYVATWIFADHAAGISIDQQTVAYAQGIRSPYEPLRVVPDTWRAMPVAGLNLPPKPQEVVSAAKPDVDPAVKKPIKPSTNHIGFWRTQWRLLYRDATALARYLGRQCVVGYCVSYIPLDYALGASAGNHWHGDFSTILTGTAIGTLLWLCGAMMFRTATAGPSASRRKG